jgi:ferritin-like metal-binding protein YciE
MKMTTLEDLFVHELKDIYHGEKQLVRALPKMAKAASSESLRDAILHHLEETKMQVERLDEVFRHFEVSARGVKCVAMEGLIEEGSEMLESNLEESVKDAAIIASAQKVEHYEIASYGTLVAFARQLDYPEAERLLSQTLEEEKAADSTLTEIAESQVNMEAQVGEEG